eukprot:2154344-Rhodomonas_salina.1
MPERTRTRTRTRTRDMTFTAFPFTGNVGKREPDVVRGTESGSKAGGGWGGVSEAGAAGRSGRRFPGGHATGEHQPQPARTHSHAHAHAHVPAETGLDKVEVEADSGPAASTLPLSARARCPLRVTLALPPLSPGPLSPLSRARSPQHTTTRDAGLPPGTCARLWRSRTSPRSSSPSPAASPSPAPLARAPPSARQPPSVGPSARNTCEDPHSRECCVSALCERTVRVSAVAAQCAG